MRVVGRFIQWTRGLSRTRRAAVYLALFIECGFFIAAVQVLFGGLGYTNMSNRLPWAAWIVGDLGLIVLGGGAFSTGFLYYILRVDSLAPLINSAVLVGLLCYLFTPIFIIFDLGQPLRLPFCLMYPNWGTGLMPVSMMTEVVFCVTLYLMVLIVEFIPIGLKHRLFGERPFFRRAGHYLHAVMWIFAATGTFLSCFHQGSLGGLFGVLYAKPALYRHHLFFLSIVAATAAGPALTILATWAGGRMKNVKPVPDRTMHTLARIAGIAFIVFFLFRLWDLYRMQTHYVPLADRNYNDILGVSGWLLLILECSLVIATLIFFNVRKYRERERFLIAGAACGVAGMIVNKFALTIHGCSVPNFPWEQPASYFPSIQEWFITLGIITTMIVIYLWGAWHLPLYPHADRERERRDEARAD